MTLYMHQFLTCPLISVECILSLTPGPSEMVRLARATCKHLSAIAKFRAKATSLWEPGSQHFPSSMNTKFLAFSLCHVEMQMSAFSTILNLRQVFVWSLTWPEVSWQHFKGKTSETNKILSSVLIKLSVNMLRKKGKWKSKSFYESASQLGLDIIQCKHGRQRGFWK